MFIDLILLCNVAHLIWQEIRAQSKPIDRCGIDPVPTRAQSLLIGHFYWSLSYTHTIFIYLSFYCIRNSCNMMISVAQQAHNHYHLIILSKNCCQCSVRLTWWFVWHWLRSYTDALLIYLSFYCIHHSWNMMISVAFMLISQSSFLIPQSFFNMFFSHDS